MKTENLLAGIGIISVVLVLGILFAEPSFDFGDNGDDVPDSHKLVVGDTEFIFSAPLEEVAKVPIHPNVDAVVNLSLNNPDYIALSIPNSCEEDNSCGMLSTAVFDISFRTSKVYQWMGYQNTYREDRTQGNVSGPIVYLNGKPENYENLTGPRVLVRKSPINKTRVVMVDDVIIIEGQNQTEVKKAADVYTLALLRNYEKYALRKVI